MKKWKCEKGVKAVVKNIKVGQDGEMAEVCKIPLKLLEILQLYNFPKYPIKNLSK
jgi:hypothetical protein